jgi:hypothetical protein
MGERFRFLRKPFDGLELEAKYLEIEQFLLGLPYPFPLQYARQLLLTQTKGAERISAIKDLIETFLKYSTGIIMSDLAERKTVNVVELKFRLLQELTLGAWIQWFESALEASQADAPHAFMPELHQLFTHDANFSKMMYQFKNYRNDKEHGYTAVDAKYDLDAKEYALFVNAFLQVLNFFARYPVFVPLNVDFATNDPDSFVYDAKVLMGTDAVLSQTRVTSRQRLKLNQIYCYSPNRHCLSLYPFASFTICRSCGGFRFYMLDRVMASECSFNATCNHRFSDKQAKVDFDQRIESVFSKSRGIGN